MSKILDKKALQQRIERKIDELEGLIALSQKSRDAVELDQTRQGRVSRQDALMQQEMAKAAHVRREVELSRLKQAIERLQTEDYGYCLNCDEEIGKARIENDPAVTLCISCAR